MPEPTTIRTFHQMVEEAIQLKRRYRQIDLPDQYQIFGCTRDEYMVIMNEPPYHRLELSTKRDEICGLRIAILVT